MNKSLAIIGVGYVGLPLALEFSKKRKVKVFDPFEDRILELQRGYDRNGEIGKEDLLRNSKSINFSYNEKILEKTEIFIITVPTPVQKNNFPDLNPLVTATKTVAKYINRNSIVIFESTVFPGACEEICVPILEEISGLKYKIDFHCGYSPERINPGDKKRTLTNTQKIVSGSSIKILNEIDLLYSSIIKAGTFKVSSLKVAEAAKLIENIQRDANIAIVNEYSSFLENIDVSSNEVFEAASTKWNFLPFKPGLVGGHCISVDPYYYIYKAEQVGMNPKLINAAREVNNEMPSVICRWMLKKFDRENIELNKIKLLIFGFSFKENTSDIRNTKINDIVNLLKEKKIKVDVADPICSKKEVKDKYKIELVDPKEDFYDAILIAVPHDILVKKGISYFQSLCNENKLIFDLKSVFPKAEGIFRL